MKKYLEHGWQSYAPTREAWAAARLISLKYSGGEKKTGGARTEQVGESGQTAVEPWSVVGTRHSAPKIILMHLRNAWNTPSMGVAPLKTRNTTAFMEEKLEKARLERLRKIKATPVAAEGMPSAISGGLGDPTASTASLFGDAPRAARRAAALYPSSSDVRAAAHNEIQTACAGPRYVHFLSG